MQDPPTQQDEAQVFPELPDLEVRRVLGRGGAGAVYEAHQPLLDRKVAVKVLHVDRHAGKADVQERFRREARLLASLEHPHIVACHTAGITASGELYLVMELVEGPDLARHIMEKGPMDVDTALRVLDAIASALAYASERGLIHRDIKPGNILLKLRGPDSTTEGPLPFTPKLADLGLARYQHDTTANEDLSALTAQGAILGTPATMAPEQFSDPDHVDFRADMYGLGCVLHAMLTGKLPYAGLPIPVILHAKMTQPPPDPAKLSPALPGPVLALAARLMARERDERHPSYAALREEIAGLLARPSVTTPLPQPAPSRGLPAWPLVGGIAGGAIVMAVLLAALRPGDEPEPPGEAATPATSAAPSPAVTAAPSPTPAPQPVTAWAAGESLIGEGFLDRLQGWTPEGGSWGAADDGPGIVGSATAEATLWRDLPANAWRIEGTMHLPAALEAGAEPGDGRAREWGFVLEGPDGAVTRFRWQDLGGGDLLVRGEHLAPGATAPAYLEPTMTVREPADGRVPFALVADGRDVWIADAQDHRIVAPAVPPPARVGFTVTGGPAILDQATLRPPSP